MKDGLIRRVGHGAIVNIDNEGLVAYKLKKASQQNQTDRLNTVEAKVDTALSQLAVVIRILEGMVANK